MSSARPQNHGDGPASFTGRGVSVEWSLGRGDAESAHSIRHLIARCLREAASSDSDLDAAELVVGELLANVVVHTGSPARVCLSWEGAHPQLEVSDDGPASGVLPGACIDLAAGRRLPDDPLATGGRGLYLVSQLARGVSVDAGPTGGATVTVTLDVARADAEIL